MTNEEAGLLSEIQLWRTRTIANPISDAKFNLDKLPTINGIHEPEVQAILKKLKDLTDEANVAHVQIIDRKLRDLRILGMK